MDPLEPDLARLAAIDQELAAMDDQLNRHARAGMRGDIASAVVAVAVALYAVVARPHVQWWVFASAAIAVALLAAGSYLQNRMLLGYRTELRDLRSGFPGKPGS